MTPRHAVDTDRFGLPTVAAILAPMATPGPRPDPAELSNAQRDVLRALEAWESGAEGMASIRQLAAASKRAYPGARRIVGALERSGWLGRIRAEKRGQADRIYARHYLSGKPTRHAVETEPETLTLPIKGRIAAGRPIEAVRSTSEETLTVPAEWVRQSRRLAGDLYVLRVVGDSMIDDGIHDGDYVLVREQAAVENGERAVALLPDGTATLKRIYRERGRVRLQPANPQYEATIVKDVAIQGLVLGLLRLF